MVYIVVVPPIRFINIGSAVGPGSTDPNHPDDVLIVRAFMIYLSNFRGDLQFTKSRVPSLAGMVDANLTQMIMDYKNLKNRASFAMSLREERGNATVVPQDVRFARVAASRPEATIMNLNLDVRPLANYGDNTVDVMCNLFPIRGILAASPVRAETYWRDLARNKIPWSRWFRNQQENAANEWKGATSRMSQRSQNEWTSDEDTELFALLHPYRDEMRAFWQSHTRIDLVVSPSPSANRQAVTVTATVLTLGGARPAGTIKILVVSQELLRTYGRQFILSSPSNRQYPLVNGSASFTIPDLSTGSYLVRAEYPDTGGIVGCDVEIQHQVT
jgi:hypothetical protein